MNKDFTKEDILKKHETNIKSASTAILLSGILGLIYVVRYILSGNFNFYFSLSFTDMLLRLSEDKGSILVPAIISVIYIFMYTSFSVLMAKSKKAFEFIKESIEVPEKCKKCQFYPLCRAGGCKRNKASADYCESYKTFFGACLPLFRVFRK